MSAPGAEVTAGRKSGRPRGYIENYRPQAKTQVLLDDALAVLEEYREHWPLSVRQIFYRLVGAHGHPKDEAFYSKLCHHLANARRAGVISFDSIRDDGIITTRMDHFDDEDAFRVRVRQQAQNYTRNRLSRQRVHVEVWCEAAGMIHQLSRVAHQYSVRVYSSSGFDSLTAKKELADRICEIGKRSVVLSLGDFDPSGESIFNSAAEDVTAFVMADRRHGLCNVEFRRVGLTAEQVELYELPTAPPKASDSRSAAWRGETCQLEALAPDQIADLLDQAIGELIDEEIYFDDIAAEEVERESLTRLLLTGPGSGA